MLRGLHLSLLVAAASLVAVSQCQQLELSPANPPAVDDDGNPCWNSFDDIREVEFSWNFTGVNITLDTLSIFHEHRTYVLCPNTVFGMGFLNEERAENGGEIFIGGQHPPFLLPNSTFLCGVDGKSSNNCRMRGGDAHMLVLTWFTGVTDVLVSGVTMDSAFEFTVLLAEAGSVTFRDCIFEKNINVGMIIGEVPDPNAPPGRRRRLSSSDGSALTEKAQKRIDFIRDQHEKDLLQDAVGELAEQLANRLYGDIDEERRVLQETNMTDGNMTDIDGNMTDTDGDMMDGNTTEPEEPEDPEEPTPPLDFPTNIFNIALYERCIFRDNTFGSDRPSLFYIINEFNPTTIVESVFENNDYSTTTLGFGPAIFSLGIVNLTNNCFIDNDFNATSLILFEPFTEQSHFSGNYFETSTPSDCQLWDVTPDNSVSCRDWDNNADMCLVVPDTVSPTMAPTDMPSVTPVAPPVAAPTSAANSVMTMMLSSLAIVLTILFL